MVEKITLQNGVRIVYEPLDNVRSASVGIWVGAGSRNETKAENGAAHFIEHMLFKGTKRRTAAQLAFDMDSVGGQINAYTTRDSTCFYARVLDSHLGNASDILCDMFFDSLFAEEDVESERGVVLEEIDMYDDAPDDIVVERLLERCFPGALGRPILGKERTLSALNGEALCAFKARHYTPGRIVVALCGSIDPAVIRELGERFSALPCSPVPETEPGKYVPALFFKKKATEQNHICLGFRGATAQEDARFSDHLMASILGGGMSSRLFQSVREKHGLCYSVSSFASSFSDTGFFGVATALDREKDRRALALILEELERLRSDGVTESELQRVREQTKSNIVIGLESSAARMNRLGYGELFLGKSMTAGELLEQYDAVTREDVLASARRLLDPKTLSFSAVGRISPREDYLEILRAHS